mmetsp:Transcript_58053/g.160485  ORF Transcript_58053/g.160485 Transcript_58053/m.160485 type:complete len:180 (+) Transcript_58053:1120-1659(+)
MYPPSIALSVRARFEGCGLKLEAAGRKQRLQLGVKAKHVRAPLQLPVPLADTDANTDATLRYAAIDKALLPTAESLKTTADRVLPYWENEIVPQIKSGKKLLIAAHGNSLRALVMHLDGISEEDITELNIPTAIPLVYELDDDMKPIPHPDGIGPVSGRYVGNQDAIRARIEGVKNQTK